MGNDSITVIKTSGQGEPYQGRKLYASIYKACIAAKRPAGEAEDTAGKICRDIEPWLLKRPEVTSLDIQVHAYRCLKPISPKAAEIYRAHRRIMA